MTETANGFMRQFEEQGYVVLEGILDRELDLQPILDHYERLVDSLSRRLADEGVLSSTYEDLSFGPRLAAVVSETGGSFFQRMEISLPQSGIDPDTPIHHPPEVFHLLRNPRLLDAVERFIGPRSTPTPCSTFASSRPSACCPKTCWQTRWSLAPSGIRTRAS